MRRTFVWIAVIGALGVLAIRVWPRAEDAPAADVVIAEAAPRVIHLAGDSIDEASCAGPALRELRAHPHWQFTFQEREWDDVVDDNPDETLATVRIDADSGVWTDGDLPQSLELEPAERADLLAAAERSCARTEERGNGFSGYYITISYGPVAHDAITLPSESRAALDVIAVLDHVRARYVAARLSAAQAMMLTLTGPRRTGEHRWERYAITVHPDGRVTDPDGEVSEPLAAIDLVDTLDWALQLPERASGAHPLTGTLEIAGTRKKIGVQLAAVDAMPSMWRSPLLSLLHLWANYNREP